MRSYLNLLDKRATNAGVNKISIYGGTVVNKKLLNPNIINGLGCTCEEEGNSVIIQNTVK